ncbi:TPA: hypothetical protein HA249_03970 [Candidatus Woesearchaeota archaeon]|nr:MAG: hypothetical protein QT07_C0010G0015 [archaeon GW2011_AR16]HIG96016.1 hypothetical protein [Candidatus Woesearchaeota archaeon]HII88494.1 hypothetical protein [Candidatus Woesearchaeota archaeon]
MFGKESANQAPYPAPHLALAGPSGPAPHPSQGAEPSEAGRKMFGEVQHEGSVQDVAGQINNISRRLRLLEERYENLRDFLRSNEQHDIKYRKQYDKEFSTFSSEMNEYRRDFVDLRDKVRLIVKELKECAKSDELKLVQNYIELWEPVTFVTERQVEKIIEEKLADLGLHHAGMNLLKAEEREEQEKI